MRSKMRMPIGDWSGDGHGQCKYYIISSALSVNKVREAHFRIKEISGVDISKLCSRDGDIIVPFSVLDKLKVAGVDINEFSDEYETDEGRGVDSDDMAYIWLTLLNYVNSNLELRIESDVPMIPHLGHSGDSVGFIGYGLF